MSGSIHVTKRNFRGLTKKEVEEQAANPDSDLRKWNKKSLIKKQIRKKRKEAR
jgi:hypothetical protein